MAKRGWTQRQKEAIERKEMKKREASATSFDELTGAVADSLSALITVQTPYLTYNHSHTRIFCLRARFRG
ncbi:unnamed protein product [Litomosoides sigmodontis]|uniref:Uncharacterized protein n=1 Tax=Litomosoides sigmodontis TaxID=42156 RepID=A0A3P6SSB3_LITSI|nr:unnamed protein product [Litomosoides sigmodontis]